LDLGAIIFLKFKELKGITELHFWCHQQDISEIYRSCIVCIPRVVLVGGCSHDELVDAVLRNKLRDPLGDIFVLDNKLLTFDLIRKGTMTLVQSAASCHVQA
jgi:hypothetical protein